MPTAYKLTIKKFIEFIHNAYSAVAPEHTHTRISRQQKRPLGVLRIPVFVAQCKRQNKLKLKFMIFYDLLTGIFSFLLFFLFCLSVRACRFGKESLFTFSRHCTEFGIPKKLAE